MATRKKKKPVKKKPVEAPVPEKKAYVKPTRAERLFRLKVVEEAMIKGARGGAIQEALAKVGRVVPQRTITDYIRAIRLKWEEEDKLFSRATRQRQLRNLYLKAESMANGKAWSAWVSCQKLIADLEGNYPKDDGAHLGTAGPEDFAGWSETELDQYVESGGEKEPKWIKHARSAASIIGEDGKVQETQDNKGMPKPSDILH